MTWVCEHCGRYVQDSKAAHSEHHAACEGGRMNVRDEMVRALYCQAFNVDGESFDSMPRDHKEHWNAKADALLPIVERVARQVGMDAATSGRDGFYSDEVIDAIVRRVMEGGQCT